VWWLVRNPLENAAQIRDRSVARHAGWSADAAYAVAPGWEERLHRSLATAWPCPESKIFDSHWEAMLDNLAQAGVDVGRGAFGGWDDGDRALARVAWCLVRHLRPERVVETGVGRGLTTRILLEGLETNGRGHLWSIDQPPPLSPHLRRQTAVAVPERLHPRWSYVRGSSRRRLPEVLRRLGPIDLFLHDSMHTTRNVEFELEEAWQALRLGGAALVDDIDMNRGFDHFGGRHAAAVERTFAVSEDGERRFGILTKRSSA
jgi:hypothetical protein